MRVIYFDSEAHLGPDVDEIYTAYRLKILTPEGLAAGNLLTSWNPSLDDLIVNELHIIRGGQVIDVLKTDKFRVVDKEDNLDYAVLDGDLTATLQSPGLQIGDELEFAMTIRRRDTIFGGKSFGVERLPAAGALGAFRVGISWNDAKNLLWRTTPDLGKIAPKDDGGRSLISVEMRDPDSAVPTDGAPSRFNVRRVIEYSQFQNWAEVSHALWPLFDKAEALAPNSPLVAEAAKIAASSADPVQRAAAALRLVQDQIRYVYVGLDGGNYRPSSADDTWIRRFGDCKAKTVLLVALLRQLGIDGEAVLVNSAGGDGTNERLPTPAEFDHVLVRARIGDRTYWLDGTRLGDTRLDGLPPPTFRWALPLRSGDASLEPVAPAPPVAPQSEELLELDASAGFDAPAKVWTQDVFRGDVGLKLRQQLSSLSREDAQRQLQGWWRTALDWVEPADVSWRYDDFGNALIVTMRGDGKPAWEGGGGEGHTLLVLGAGLSPPAPLRRPKEQDQAAPWLTNFPAYARWTTIIKPPPNTKKWLWDYVDEPVHRSLGGVFYWREASLRNGVFISTMSKRTFLPELTTAQADAQNNPAPPFDNAVSQLFQISAATQAPHRNAPPQALSTDTQRLLSAAETATAAGHAAEVLADLDPALALEPESAAVLKSRGAVLSGLGRHEAALADFDEAWRIDPLDASLRNARTQELHTLGRTEEVDLFGG